MMRNGFVNRSRTWLLAGILSFLCLSASAAFIEEEEEEKEMSASGLLSEAGNLLALEQYDAATPFLVKYLDRMKEVDDKRVRAMMQDIRLKLGKISAYLYDSEAAIVWLDDYLVNRPLYKRREALKLLALNSFEMCDYEKTISAVTNAFAPPPVIEEVEEKVKIETLTKEERGGVSERRLRRYEAEAEEGEEDDLFKALSAEKPEEEPEYTLEERVVLNLTLAESYAALEEWEASLEPYQFVIDHAVKMKRKGYAIMQQIRSLIELSEFDRVRTMIFQLVQTDARYDIRVNTAIMNAAAALYNAAEYDSALMLYRLVLPRHVLSDYWMVELNELRKTTGLSEVEVTLQTNEVGRIETMFGAKYVGVTVGMTVRDAAPVADAGGIGIPMEVQELQESIYTLWSLRPYEEDVVYRMGQIYAGAGRPWEALASFDRVTAHDPDSDLGSQAFCDALQVLRDPLKEYDRLETRALGFLKERTEGLFPRQAAYQLTAAYQVQERMKDIKTLRPVLKGFAPAVGLLEVQYDCELWYMQAIADLMLLNYKEALAGFDQVLADYPKSHLEENLTYWHAMTQLFLQNYALALAEFETYLGRFPNGLWRADPWFHSGICLFALEKYELSMERFTHVIDQFPGSSVYSDACSMRGDLFAADGQLSDAQRDYEEAIATARTPKQDTYAVFQMAAMFELEERYDEIVSAVNAYLERQADAADVAKAAYWIGKTKLQQGLIHEAVDIYCTTIVDYGGDLHQEGVDRIITELVLLSRRLEAEELDPLRERLSSALTVAESITLKLRLRVLLARMEGTEAELGTELLDNLEDLNQAPPPVLALICKASFARKDYSRAEEMLTIFLNHFEESDSIRSAYKLRAFDLDLKGESAAALKIVNEVQALYGTDSDAAWAQLMKGRLEVEQGNLDAARKTFRAVFNVRAWRGESYAEAAYSLGELEEKAGDLKQAFAWYQRTYSQYKAHAKGYWAAESYLASAQVLNEMGRETDMRNTFRAMLFDPYVNTLPQAETAQAALGADEVLEIAEWIATGGQTNIVVNIEPQNKE